MAASSSSQLANVPEGVGVSVARAIAGRLRPRRTATTTRRSVLRRSGRYNLAPTPAPAPAQIRTTGTRIILKNRTKKRSMEERINNPIIDLNDCDEKHVDKNDEAGSGEEPGEENGAGEEDTDVEEASEGDVTEDVENSDQENPPTELEKSFEKMVLFGDDFHFNDADFSVLLLVQVMVAGKFPLFRRELEKLVCEQEKRMTKNVRMDLAKQVLASGADHFVTVKNPHKDKEILSYSVLDLKYIMPKKQPAAPDTVNGLAECLQGMSMGGLVQVKKEENE